MNIDNSVNKLNTQYSANAIQTTVVPKSAPLSKEKDKHLQNNYYRSDLVFNTPKNATSINTKNRTVTNLYSPKQLLVAYSNPKYVNALINSNPNIEKILLEHGVEPKINVSNVKNIMNTHLTTTTAYALQIANKLGLSANDKKDLEMACVFHDFGKILIPEEIISKPNSLTNEEKEIIDLHAQLGYELLSSTGLNERVLNLIKNHHMPQGQNADILGQILSVADIYSALREERSYKQELEEEDALYILNQKAINGEVSTEVVDALKASVISASVA